MTELSAFAPALGWHPSDFALEGTDGRYYRLTDVRGAKGTLVMFICNHYPYVKAVLDDIIRDVQELKEHGIGAIGVMPNDVAAYPADSLENMRRLAEAKQLPFPYVIDRTQEVAHTFGAACTPDFFGFNADLELQYRGRIYAVRNLQRIPGSGRELFNAMVQIAKTSRGPTQQNSSMGCSIKWRD
jgi:peroxiredoxin